MKPKVMISQPMCNKSCVEILAKRAEVEKYLNEHDCDIVGGLTTTDIVNSQYKSLSDLGVALCSMSKCDYVYFCRGWHDAIDCRIEHEVAVAYGLQLIYEE